MDTQKLDPDFFARQGAYTPHIHRDLYPSIDPRSPALSQREKVVIITGSSSGIGANGIAPAFAQAGARAIVLVGRRSDRIGEVASSLRKGYPDVEILEAPLSITNDEAVLSLFAEIRAKFGGADVLVNNAGVQTEKADVAFGDPKSWWRDLEVNLRGTYLVTRSFLKQVPSGKHGTVISVSSGAAFLALPGLSSYGTSKLAINWLNEHIAAECENVTTVTLDPGTVDTDMMVDQFRKFAKDTPALVGGVSVWLATNEAAFLNGRTVGVNWSVDDLLARKDAILASNDLKVSLRGNFGLPS